MHTRFFLLLLAAACQPPTTADDDKQVHPTDTADDTADTASGTDADADGFTTADGDCDDGDDTVHPNAAEDCTAVDRNCDGDPTNGLLYGLQEERHFPDRPNRQVPVATHWFDLTRPSLPQMASTNRLWDTRKVLDRVTDPADGTVYQVTEYTLVDTDDLLTLRGETMAPEGALDLAPEPVEFILSYETENSWRRSDGAHIDHYYGWPTLPREYRRISTFADEGYVSSEEVTEGGETFTIDYTADLSLHQTTATYSPTPSLPDEEKEWNTVLREHDADWRILSERIAYHSGWISLHELEYDEQGRLVEERWGSSDGWYSGTSITWKDGFPSRVTTHDGTGDGVPYFHEFTPTCEQPDDWRDHLPQQR